MSYGSLASWEGREVFMNLTVNAVLQAPGYGFMHQEKSVENIGKG